MIGDITSHQTEPQIMSGPASATEGCLLAATDGSEWADGAIRMARLLGDRLGADIELLSVLQMPDVPAFDPVVGAFPEENATARRDALRTRIEGQLQALRMPREMPRAEIVLGKPATTIARLASARRARAILMGVGRHNVLDRVAGSETALHVLRRSDVPLLAVARDATTLPTRALVAMDFSVPSIRAARQAIDLLGDFAAIDIVHVLPKGEPEPQVWNAWEETWDGGVRGAFERLLDELRIPPGTIVDTMSPRGDPAFEILRLARRRGSDLIVSGSRGHGFMERLLVGSVAEGLIRGASCSVFVVPEPRERP